MSKFGGMCRRRSCTLFTGCFRDSKCTPLAKRSRKTAVSKVQRRWVRTPFCPSNFGILIRRHFCRLFVIVRSHFGHLKRAKTPFSGAVR